MNTHLTAPTAMPQTNALIATLVPHAQRSRFWYQHVGSVPQWFLLEPHVFNWLGRLCADYHGGQWDFYTLSNGGVFISPQTEDDKHWALFNSLNGNGAEMGVKAAGITACLMAFNHHACRTEHDAMIEHFYRLREFALHHPDSRAIFALID